MLQESRKSLLRKTLLALLLCLSFLFFGKERIYEAVLKSNDVLIGKSSIKEVSFGRPSRHHYDLELVASLPIMFQEKVLGINTVRDGSSRPSSSSIMNTNTSSTRSRIDGRQIQSYLFPDLLPDDYPEMMMDRAWSFKNESFSHTVNNSLTALIQSACSLTSQVELVIDSPIGATNNGGNSSNTITNSSTTRWILYSRSRNGIAKSVGGDEYYVIYTDEAHESLGTPTAVARVVHDSADGKYQLNFSSLSFIDDRLRTTPMNGTGRVDIYLEWSCGLGMLHPPLKESWYTGGMTNAYWNRTGIPAPTDMYLFEPPNNSKKQQQQSGGVSSRINLGIYNAVVNVGDSTMVQFVSRNYCQGLFQRNIKCKRPSYTPYYTSRTNITLEKVNEAKDDLLDPTKRVAILLGSNAWDVTADHEYLTLYGPSMNEFVQAARLVIHDIRSLYPNATIYWRSGGALHPHRLLGYTGDGEWYDIRRGTYFSNSRARFHHQLEKKLMEELGVPFLDIFEATNLCAHKHKLPSDGLHYIPPFNKVMLNWFYG